MAVIDPTQPIDDQAQKFVIACAIDPVTKRPYPVTVNETTGGLIIGG